MGCRVFTVYRAAITEGSADVGEDTNIGGNV